MSDQKLVDDGADSELSITLGLLNAVHGNSQLTQRSMASELGIALGLANAYLKRCVKKGLIKVNQIPPNRYSYYLTPQGFTEKARLTSEYLSSSFNFFRKARAQCTEVIEACAARGCSCPSASGCCLGTCTLQALQRTQRQQGIDEGDVTAQGGEARGDTR